MAREQRGGRSERISRIAGEDFRVPPWSGGQRMWGGDEGEAVKSVRTKFSCRSILTALPAQLSLTSAQSF